MTRLPLLLLAALCAPLALASGGEKGFGPFGVNPDLTTGRMEFFRELYLDPSTVAEQLTPKAPLAAPGPNPVTGEPAPALHSAPWGDLHIPNTTQSFVDVKVGGVKLGRVGPLTTAVVHQVRSGVYELEFTLPNGYSWTETAATVMPSLVRDPAVSPEPLLQGQAPAAE